MKKKFLGLRLLLTLVFIVSVMFVPGFDSNGDLAFAQSTLPKLRYIRSISTSEFGLSSPKGMTYSVTANSFTLFGSSEISVGSISLYEQSNGTGRLSGSIDNFLNVAFDEKSGAYFALSQSSSQLSKFQASQNGMPIHTGSPLQYSVGSLNLDSTQGITFDPATGRLIALVLNPARLIIVSPDPVYGFDGDVAMKNGRVRQTSISITDTDLQGIAFNPENKHLYIGGIAKQVVYEITELGKLVAVYDISEFKLKKPGSMLFAPSRDETDDPATMDLYVLDLGNSSVSTNLEKSGGATSGLVSNTQDAQIVEMSLSPAASLPSGTTLIPTTLVQIIDTSNVAWNPSSPDPSGVDYWPSRDRLIIADSEVDEMPNYFTGKNVFLSTTSGMLTSTCSTTNLSRTGFSNEPTGIAVNPVNDHIFISQDDGGGKIFEISMGSDGVYCTGDDVVVTLSLSSIIGIDAEDVAIGQNTLFIAGGTNAEVYLFNLGPNGEIGGGDDGPITSFDTAVLGFNDLEGIDYNDDTGTLFIVSTQSSDNYLGEVSTSGALIRAYNLSLMGSGSNKRSDVSYAPSSQNPQINNIYIVSRGVDNNTDPNENDGRIWEININGSSTPTPVNTSTWTPTPTAPNTPNPNGTSTFTPSATFTPTSLPSSNPFLASFASNGSVGGFTFSDEDILSFNGTSWSLVFDGSDVGLGSVDVFGFYKVDNDTFLMSFDKAITINGLAIAPTDIVQFDATSLGSVTSGIFSMYLNGGDVGLDTTAENIDAVDILPDGRILISTTGNSSVPIGAGGTLSGADEDILAFTPVNLGLTTSGSWSMYFDGSDVGLADTTSEDIDALDVNANGDVFLSTLGLFSVQGVSGDDEDVFVCSQKSLGSNTSCLYSSSLYFDGSTWGLAANDLDGFSLDTAGTFPTSTPSVTFTSTATVGPSPTGTFSATPTSAPTITATVTVGPSPTSTNTSTPTPTFMPSNTPTNTSTPTSTLTPSPTDALPDMIFADGFENGNLTGWTANSTNNGSLSVSSNSALAGSYGMQAAISGQTNMYVRDDSPVAESRYRARFYFDPNSVSMANSDYIYILQGYAATTNAIMLRLEFKYSNGTYQMRLKVLDNSGTWLNTAYVTIGDTPHVLEFDWLAASAPGANNGQAVFWVDGVQQGSLAGVANDSYRLESIRFGVPYLSSATMSGTIYFDAFESRRQNYIGP